LFVPRYVFPTVTCDSRLFSHNQSLCHELVPAVFRPHFLPNKREHPIRNGEHSRPRERLLTQARACNTLAFRTVARLAANRHGARRPAPWPQARTGARTATLPWRGARGAGKGAPTPPPRQRRRPADVARRPPEGPSLRRAAHLRTAGGAADTAHGRTGGTDRCATGRLQPRRSMASENADEPPLQKLASRHDHPRVIVGGLNPGSCRARWPRATRGRGRGQGGRRPVTPVAGQSFSAT